MKPGEKPWDLDHKLKCTVHKANMNLMDGQHREWSVAFLLPHLRVALSQQNIGTHAEALEIAMRLHETMIQDDNLGVQKIQTQFQSLYLEFQSLKKDRAVQIEVREEVWCLKCKSQGDDKDHYLVFMNYDATGGQCP